MLTLHIFLGGAGVGKSRLIVVLAVHADKILAKVEGKNSSSRPRLMLLGPTGVCASLIGN